MSAQREYGLVTVEADIESSPQQLPHHRNLVTSPLLRLPAELIVKIFEHAIEHDSNSSSLFSDSGPTVLVLTAICQELRNIGITAPLLWSTVDLTIPPLAELFLQRCNYVPRTLKRLRSAREKRAVATFQDPRREAVWTQLEGRTFNNLRALAFEGTLTEFKHRVVPILETATNVLSLDLQQPIDINAPQLPWHPTSPTPYLSILRLYGFSIGWTSPLLRNLTQMTLDLGLFYPLPQQTPVETFLAALANCPDLELLKLVRTGPSPSNGHLDECDVVVRLCRLQELFLDFECASTIGYILSHIRYPESARLEAGVSMDNPDLSEAISQIIPRNNPGVLSQFQKTRELNIRLDTYSSTFSTDKSIIRCWNWAPEYSPQALYRAMQQVLEVVGKDVVALSVDGRDANLTGEIWESFLHRLPGLERIRWCGKAQNPGVVDPFISAFSRRFEGGLVCPRLTHLELSREMVIEDQSATLLKRTLTERNACGVRLKWMGLCDTLIGWELYNEPMLEQFLDLVDEVR